MPKLEVEPFEHRVVPLAQIDELDNAHDIQGLHEKEAGQNGYDFVVHGRGKATMRAVSMIVASMPLPPASIVIAKPVVASRSMRPWAMTASSKGKIMTVLSAANSPVKG